MSEVRLFISVPVASFRVPRAREFLETLPVPPPATVYGMLLSAVGEGDRLVHRGAEVAIGSLRRGQRSRVLRTSWRVKSSREDFGIGENKRPDFQEILTGVRLAVAVRDGEDRGEPRLADRVELGLRAPERLDRFGGLALGESTMLVDDYRILRSADLTDADGVDWIVHDAQGRLPLPVWVDHVGSTRTRYEQFSMRRSTAEDVPETAWICVEPSAEP